MKEHNEAQLKINDLFTLEDRVAVLEGFEPNPHSGTMTKVEIDTLGDRISDLSGEDLSGRLDISKITKFDTIVTELEETPKVEYVTLTINLGNTTTYKGEHIFTKEFVKGETYNLDTWYNTYKDDISTTETGNIVFKDSDTPFAIVVKGDITLNTDTTLYASWSVPDPFDN